MMSHQTFGDPKTWGTGQSLWLIFQSVLHDETSRGADDQTMTSGSGTRAQPENKRLAFPD